jgi:septal ring factor EnvC (AmiA/AmiB activator)
VVKHLGSRTRGRRGFGAAAGQTRVVRAAQLTCLVVLLAAATAVAQTPDRTATDTLARRVNERIRVLQGEADRLSAQARTLLGDLRQLEIQRDIAIERVKEADAAVAQAQGSLQQTTNRLTALEQERIAQLPDLKLRLVDIYKRGHGGYARTLLDVRGVREFARAMRATAALTTINERRIAEHRRTLAELRQQRDVLEQRTKEMQKAANDAARERTAAQRAVAAREALIAQIDARRDLNAQLAGELNVASQRLRDYVANLAAGRSAEPVAVPLTSFRGALDWPVPGRVIAGFELGTGRAPGSLVRNGIEIGAVEGTPVLAVHPGTVDYADAFTGFGNLVIIDHGSNYYSLYGYLGSAGVQRGDHVDAGTELGRVGTPPTGPPALYFELRVDGRSIDPVQWLKPRL